MAERGELDLTGAKQNTGVWLVKVMLARLSLAVLLLLSSLSFLRPPHFVHLLKFLMVIFTYRGLYDSLLHTFAGEETSLGNSNIFQPESDPAWNRFPFSTTWFFWAPFMAPIRVLHFTLDRRISAFSLGETDLSHEPVKEVECLLPVHFSWPESRTDLCIPLNALLGRWPLMEFLGHLEFLMEFLGSEFTEEEAIGLECSFRARQGLLKRIVKNRFFL